MELQLYHVDAFADRLFTGNPAAVCPLREWIPDDLMQRIAAENNLAETAFYVDSGARAAIRWFTPAAEVDLCGHATLAAAYVMFHDDGGNRSAVEFSSRGGVLRVTREQEWFVLDFPVDVVQPVATPQAIVAATGREPRECYKGKSDFMVVYADESDVARLEPDYRPLMTLPGRGVIVTAAGREVDFVSRFFAPNVGVPEDPVTGSAHTTLTPYWAGRLGRCELSARQLSRRGGTLRCALRGDRVHIAGRVVPYLVGRIVV